MATCRLPVLISDVRGTNQRPGFLSLPGDSLEEAAGARGQIYNPALGRWVAGDWRGLSADGFTFAYVEGDTKVSRIHLTGLRTGTDRVINTGGPWSMVGLQAEGAYVVKLVYGPPSQAYGSVSTPQGLWLVSLTGAAPKQLTADHRAWHAVGVGAVWGAEFNKADPHPYGGDLGYASNQLVRLDLKTRAAAPWLYRPGFGVSVMGLDVSGVPFVQAQNSLRQEVWRLVASKPPAPIWSGKWGELAPAAPMAVDGAKVWLSSFIPSEPYSPAVFRWSAEKGLELAAQLQGQRIIVAGPCA